MTTAVAERPVVCSLIALAMAGISLVAAPAPDGLFGGFLALMMLAIAVNDARDYIIPDVLTAAAVGLGLLRAGICGPDADLAAVGWALLRGAAVALPWLLMMIGYRRLRGRDGLGLGDVKLAAVAGVWLGWVTTFAAMELAALVALGAYLVAGLWRRRPMKTTAFLPFGLFLAPAIWIGWLCEALLL
ncbi:A24 family peptidase [Tardiphaga sp.]|uniref:prepilin peptidase n=1 Tax=Tardiphaga sp. TaxID=1926292 RepID=UPI0026049569|nr:A24 family peptidase [Tardiphaga sp.]MDB5617788.1 prepilin peptidase [Tardiphaga sp.]